MDENSSSEKLLRELAYYKKQLDQISGESIQHDFVLSSLRHEVQQKKEALSILANLQREFSVATPVSEIYAQTVKAIDAQLSMDYSVVLVPASRNNRFKAGHWHGFQEEQVSIVEMAELEIPPSLFTSGQYILLNKAMVADEISLQIQKNFMFNYFVGVPVILDDKPISFIITGRKFEKLPFIPALDKGDAETLMSIAGLISTVLQNKKMMELRLQKAEVEKQKEAISAQRDKLEETLNELRNTQARLIQSEKMASLGALTAGIAHEIQNPLNFVNNFSELNAELIDELNHEIKNQNLEAVKTIAHTIRENHQKINHHGKRADGIVKGMLQHSRANAAQKEDIDINGLADEYLRLSYHGLRAKDNSFHAKIETDFDSSIGKLNIVPQEIGRVLLNLYNNAFYAVSEKKRRLGEIYEPLVSVKTRKIDGNLELIIRDNGTGISEKVAEKIFQPFFTTKPAGHGTGLGLSLSYDIIKMHAGELKVETREGEYAEFIVKLPI